MYAIRGAWLQKTEEQKMPRELPGYHWGWKCAISFITQSQLYQDQIIFSFSFEHGFSHLLSAILSHHDLQLFFAFSR